MKIQNRSGEALKRGLLKRQFSKLTREESEAQSPANQQPNTFSPFTSQQFYYGNIPMSKEIPHWGCSSATLRHSSRKFRFSVSDRFPDHKSNYHDAQKLQYPSLLGQRSASLGFGKKSSIPQVFGNGNFKASQNCPFYEVDQESIKRLNSAMILGAGKTFGIGWRYYEASRTPHRSTVHSIYQQRMTPGPNHYALNPEGNNDSPKILMNQRLEMFTTRNGSYRRNQPDPQSYSINENFIKRQHCANGFGYGQKTDFTKQREKTPGPIYKQKSICDKFIHLKLKLKIN